MQNNIELIEYGYMYVHNIFSDVLQEWGGLFDEIRTEDTEHNYFYSRYPTSIIEMPSEDVFRFSNELYRVGIPHFYDYSCTEEYAMYKAFATNKGCEELPYIWTSMNSKKEIKVTKFDAKFFNSLSILRAAHMKLNKDITYEETLNAYHSHKGR